MKAHCSMHSSVSYRGMRGIQPARRMRTASIFAYTWSGHLSPRFSAKPVPTKRKGTIALVITVVSIIISHSSDKVFQVRVVGAFCKNTEDKKKTIPDIRKRSLKKKFYALSNHGSSKCLPTWALILCIITEKRLTISWEKRSYPATYSRKKTRV